MTLMQDQIGYLCCASTYCTEAYIECKGDSAEHVSQQILLTHSACCFYVNLGGMALQYDCGYGGGCEESCSVLEL